MSSPSHTEVNAALWDLVKDVTWDTPARGFLTKSRRLQIWTDCPQQPAIYMVTHDDQVARVTNMPYKEIWQASLVIYQNTGADPNAEPTLENDLIIDAIRAVLTPDEDTGFVQEITLGGLVHSVKISGTLFRDAGDLDGQGVIVIPIEIMVP